VIVVVAPEPGAWIAPTARALATLGEVAVWAPWTVAARWGGLPGAVGRFARRRRLDGADGQPGWALAQAAVRAWAGARVDRRYRLSFGERALADAWAARRLARLRRPPRAVVACTGAALRTFAVAAQRGVACALVADLPWLRRLHDDLDRAAEALPARAFLRRFRAPREAIVRQEQERALATVIAVRGHYAADVCRAAGVAAERVVAVPAADAEADGAPGAPGGGASDAIVLAGIASARTGLDAALAARDRHPGLRLRVRVGDGTEPADLLRRAGVEAIAGDPMAGALAVIAPAWCESYPPEVAAAIGRGVPVIASPAAAGFAPARLVTPGDGEALAVAIAAVRAGAPIPRPRTPLPALVDALG
jgi:hypothetical protein